MEAVHIPFCSIVAVDTSNFCYRVCRTCETLLLGTGAQPCRACPSGSAAKMLYRLQLSIATEDRVIPVVAFDRAAQKLMGCSADQFFEFASSNPCAAHSVREILLGEMVAITLKPPQSGRAQHMRVVSVVPLASNFEQIMNVLQKVYTRGAECGE